MSGWNERNEAFRQQAQPYLGPINIDDFVHSTYCSLKHHYFYGESPKTGCSTIKKVLIQAELGERFHFDFPDYIHYREFTPFLKVSQVGQLERFFQRQDILKFCFVRNPYTRLLSCYLDKIKKDKFQSRQIKIQLGLDPDNQASISFQDFVEAVVQQPVEKMDQHWRIQYYQTFQSNIEYDFVGKFERFETDFMQVLKLLKIDPEKYYDEEKSHATAADTNIMNYYTAELAEKVYHKYRIDFEYFGYKKVLS